MLKVIIAAIMMFSHQMGYAVCKEGMPSLLAKQLQIRLIDESMAQCKVWPSEPSKMIVVLLLPQEASDPDQSVYDLGIFVVEADSGNVLNYLYQKGALIEDAIRITGVEIDTGRYQLGEGLRAFGIRIGHEGSSAVNPLNETELNLYVMHGKELRRVLTRLVVSSARGSLDAICTGTFSEISRTLINTKGESQGYADILVHEKITRRENRMRQGQCVELTQKPVSRNYTLRYEGTAYPIPKELTYELN